MTFKQYMNEIAGSFALVSCKDSENPNFQVWGAMSDLKCQRKKDGMLKMKFKGEKESSYGKANKKQ